MAAIVVLASLSSCSLADRHAEKTTADQARQDVETSVHSPGVQCVPYGKTRPEGPRNYSINDLNKAGVPKLSQFELDMVRTIQRYVRSKLLRFAFVGNQFIIFNAKFGPCLDNDYQVLNGTCNEFYEPGEDPWKTGAMPGDACGPRRPWVPNDPGGNNPSYWNNP